MTTSGTPARPTIVVSDIHLGEIPPEGEETFLSFLQSLPGKVDELLINGDLFDFWFEYHSVILRRYFPVLRRLADLVDAGVRVRLVGGNHDAWTGSFLGEEIGIELLDAPVATALANRRAYVAHGDGLLDGEGAYRAFRGVIRSRAFRALFRLAPPDLSLPLVRRVSGTPARLEGRAGDDHERADRLGEHARALLASRPEIDLVVFGDTHRPELVEVEPGRHYLNAGDWIHHRSYAVLTADSIELRHWHLD
jgi:UDP-2,3-diacylglucosamine hydrolase